MSTTTPPEIIGRGAAGWHAAGRNWSSSGGDLMPYTYWTGKKCHGYAAQAPDGCPVYDAEHVSNSESFIRFVIGGPMESPGLPPGHWRAPMQAHSEPAPDTMPAAGISLHYVAVDVYLKWLAAAVPGVKFGTVRAGSVLWNDGTTTEPDPKHQPDEAGR